MPQIRQLSANSPDFESRLSEVLAWESVSDHGVQQRVDEILNAIIERGDSALIEFTNRFDRTQFVQSSELEVSRERIEQSLHFDFFRRKAGSGNCC